MKNRDWWEEIDGWMAAQIDRQTDRHTDEQTGRHFCKQGPANQDLGELLLTAGL